MPLGKISIFLEKAFSARITDGAVAKKRKISREKLINFDIRGTGNLICLKSTSIFICPFTIYWNAFLGAIKKRKENG
jgi:hypothetical protein